MLKNCKSFELAHIFECGQCFRWNKQEDGSYTGVFGENVINVSKQNQDIVFRGVCNDDIQSVCKKYFDLDEDYESLKNNLSKIDEYVKTSISYGEGIRILRQDLWETLISFIISANNNIPRIKGIIERISQKYGNKIIFENKEYYTFPTPKQLSKASVQDLRNLGLGFRDVRVFETTKMVNENIIDLEKLKEETDVNTLRDTLLKFPGVGPKVADCIMLFSLKKLEVFPVDVWVKRVMTELYMEENETSPEKIKKFAYEKYGNLAGLAQQYLFYWRREKEA